MELNEQKDYFDFRVVEEVSVVIEDFGEVRFDVQEFIGLFEFIIQDVEIVEFIEQINEEDKFDVGFLE